MNGSRGDHGQLLNQHSLTTVSPGAVWVAVRSWLSQVTLLSEAPWLTLHAYQMRDQEVVMVRYGYHVVEIRWVLKLCILP